MFKIRVSNFLMIFGRSQEFMGRPTSKHYVLGPWNEILKPRKSDSPIGQTSKKHNSLNLSPN